jgi:RNA polymerase sigma-70 factor (ECF subfamily)
VDEVTKLALASASGDRVALHRFVRATQADVWRFCAHLVGRDDADDVTQDVYLRACRALPRFRGDATARTWLLGIARRTAADHVRRQRLRRRTAIAQPSVVADADGQVTVTAAIAELEAERRAAFVLTQILGLSYAEAAQVCRCPVGTIRSRLARARADLIAALDAGEQQGGSRR